MSWLKLHFGQHEGKTLPEVVWDDPDYFFFAFASKWFNNGGVLRKEAKDIYFKARNIKIPQIQGQEQLIAKYYLSSSPRKFSEMKLVPVSQSGYDGKSAAVIMDVIDLAVPRQYAQYDKDGYADLIGTLKALIFGNEQINLTKRKCERYFEDDDNFELPTRTEQTKAQIIDLPIRFVANK